MVNKKISELPAAATITGTETVPLLQAGVTRGATVTQLLALIVASAPGNLDTFFEVATQLGLDEATVSTLQSLVAGKAPAMTVATPKTAAYTAAANEIVPVDATTATVSITLPTAPADKTRVTVKKIDASTNAVTFTTGAGDVFNKAGGSTTATLALTNQSATVQYSAGIWYVVASDTPLSQLDLRYTTTTQADARYTRQRLNTVGALGDSITQNGYVHTPSTVSIKQVRGYWVWALALTGQRLRFVAQGGVAGETTTQMIARLPAYLAAGAHWNWVLAGINDALQNVALSTITANLTTIWNAIESNGGRVVAVTLPPNTNATTAQRTIAFQVNEWIRRQGQTRKGLIVADAFEQVSDATGIYAGNMSNDGTHPVSVAAYRIGLAVANAMTPQLGGTGSLPFPGDPANLFTNAGATGTTGTLGTGVTGTAATGWTVSNIGASSVTTSLVQRTDGVAGFWHHIVVTSGGAYVNVNISTGSAWSVGDTVYAVAELKPGSDLAPTANGQYLRMKFSAVDTGFGDQFQTYDLSNDSGQPFPPTGTHPTSVLSLATIPFVIPAATNRSLTAGIQSTVPGSFDVGRVGIYKLGTGPLFDAGYSLYTAV